MNKKLRRKKLIINIVIVVSILLITSLISLALLTAFDVIKFRSDGITFDEHLFDKYKNSWYGYFIFIFAQAILTMLLSIVPGVSMAFILLSMQIYPNSWQAFGLSFVSVMISSFSMYLLGRLGGYKICLKLLGKEDCEKSLALLRDRGSIYFPLMMLFPIFPDDALVMIAGTLKMKLKWFIPSIILGRGIGIATIVFGFSIIPFDKFSNIYDWIIFLTVCTFWIMMFFHWAHKLNAKIEKKNSEPLESIEVNKLEEN